MLHVTVTDTDPLKVDADLLVVPVFKGGIEGPGVAPVLDALQIGELPTTPEFRGDIGQTLTLAAPGLGCGAVMLVGLGRMDASNAEQLRRAAAIAARRAGGARRLATTLPQVDADARTAAAVAEGLWLGSYRYDGYRTEPQPPPLEEALLLVATSQQQRCTEAVARARIYAGATTSARDLVNLPPADKRPAALAAKVAELAGAGCEVTVTDDDELTARGFGGMLAVGRGSTAPPRLVEIRYRPENPLGHVVLVGKGITFDTGGLSLKRGTHMATMKSDMAGAAAVAAVCSVLADLGVRLEVTGLLALAENMPGADAQRPGDIVTHYGGTTAEVIDTDAEGRLVLADALAYGAEMQPDAMVDLATLTGTAIAAVGHYAAALMSTDDDLRTALCAAAEVSGESLWPLPLWPDLERFLDSPVADMNNTADGPGGGSITAGLFLKRFTGDTAWAHLDIAGPAFLPSELATHYLLPGGTGFGVRTLLAWLERRVG